VPGGISRWMAVPWQCDTASCRSGYDKADDPYVPTFWPARVPNQVLTAEDYAIVTRETRRPSGPAGFPPPPSDRNAVMEVQDRHVSITGAALLKRTAASDCGVTDLSNIDKAAGCRDRCIAERVGGSRRRWTRSSESLLRAGFGPMSLALSAIARRPF
jgi:hypothetical protein